MHLPATMTALAGQFHAAVHVALYTPHGRWYVALVAGVGLLLFLLRRYFLLFSLAALPGTLLHELAHVLVGAVSFGRPGGISVWPRRTPRGYVLGSARFANVRWFNAGVIGLAPLLLLLPLAVGVLAWRLHAWQALRPAEVAWAYLIATLLYACLPSWQDIKVALVSRWLFVALAAAYWIATNEGFHIAKLPPASA